MNVKRYIVDQISTALKALELPQITPEVNFVAGEKFGDLSTNVAMVLYSQLKAANADFQAKYNSPRALAEAIVAELTTVHVPATNVTKSIFQNKPEVAGPGFINFRLSEQFLLSELNLVNGKSNTQQITSHTEDVTRAASHELRDANRIIIEFTDPNPFKEFHMGHLYSNIVGESLARLFEYTGNEVKRVCYQGDVGMHVAKSLWGMLKKLQVTIDKEQSVKASESQGIISELETQPLSERAKWLGQCYALGANAYKDNPEAAQEIKDINYYVFISAQQRLVEEENWTPQVNYKSFLPNFDEQKLAVVDLLYRTGRAWSLDAFEVIYQRLGTKFKDYYFESVVGEYGYKLVKDNLGKVFEESNGAIVFPGDKYGLHTRVFINSLGLPTYEAKELGLGPKKLSDWPYNKSYIVTGNEITEYFKVLLKAMSLINPEIAAKTTHIGHGMLRLPEGKMSSRTGNVLTGETILDEAKDRALSIIKEGSTLSDQEKDLVAEQVGKAAIKYALLKADVGGDVVFNFEESVSFNGNSGPYLQYTHARCKSILRKADELGNKVSMYQSSLTHELINSSTFNLEELSVLRWIWRFPLIVDQAATQLEPHQIASYLYELAQRYNSFYNRHSVLNQQQATSNTQQVDPLTHEPINSSTQFRLALTAATAKLLQEGLYLLGIEAPEKM